MDYRSFISANLSDIRARDIRLGEINIHQHFYGTTEPRLRLHVGVPPKPVHFVGRGQLVAELAQRLSSGAGLALSIDGLPGVGKTSLAIALTYEPEILKHFTDGVLWAGLGLQSDPMSILATWAVALGADASDTNNPLDRAQRVRNAIGQRRLLLVIDDAWPSTDSTHPPEEIALQLKCGGPNCMHLLTTRHHSIAEAFAGPQSTIVLPVLEPVHALELLTMLAPDATEADPNAAEELTQRVGYLPLAIELIGAYLSATENHFFRSSVNDAFQRLSEPGERLRQVCKRLGVLNEPRLTLEEVIRLSLEGLPEDAVDAFDRLGAFAPKPEKFDLPAALMVTGASSTTLSLLGGRHLLEKTADGRLSVHQMIAEVARESCPFEAKQAHATYYFFHVTRDVSDWHAIEEVYGQVKWAYANMQDATSVLAFAAALKVYQELRGLRSDQVEWSDREIAAAMALENGQKLATALNDRGVLHIRISDPKRGLEYFKQALSIRRALGLVDGTAANLVNIGVAYAELGKLEDALAYCKEAFQLQSNFGTKEDVGLILANIGGIYKNMGDHKCALEHYEKALSLLRVENDPLREGAALANMGSVYEALNEREKALNCYEQALSMVRNGGDLYGEAMILGFLGDSYASCGEHERALEYYGQARLICRDIRAFSREVQNITKMAVICETVKEWSRALELYQEALPIRRTLEDWGNEADTLLRIGDVYWGLEEVDHALVYYEQALAGQRNLEDEAGEAVTLAKIGNAYLISGSFERGIEYYELALPLLHADGNQQAEAATLANLATASHRVGQSEQALLRYNQALHLMRSAEDHSGVVETLKHIAIVYDDINDYVHALEYYRQVLPHLDAVGPPATRAEFLQRIGVAHHRIGELVEAIQCYEQALEFLRIVENTSSEAKTLCSIGAIYSSIGEQERALVYYAQAIPLVIASGDHEGEATIRFLLGQSYRETQRMEEAAAELRQAATIWQSQGSQQVEDAKSLLATVETEIAEGIGRFEDSIKEGDVE